MFVVLVGLQIVVQRLFGALGGEAPVQNLRRFMDALLGLCASRRFVDQVVNDSAEGVSVVPLALLCISQKMQQVHSQEDQVNSKPILEHGTTQVHALTFAGELCYCPTKAVEKPHVEWLSLLRHVRPGDLTQ